MRIYKVGNAYIDKGGKLDPQDQLLRWLESDEKTIANMGGIRIKSFTKLDKDDTCNIPSSLFLFTEKTNNTAIDNPWQDVFDLITGDIEYWGDAKYDPSGIKTEILDWNGNKHLNNIFMQIKNKNIKIIPPIFHFTKETIGKVTFNGLFIMSDLITDTFNHKGHEIENYRVKLKKLEENEIFVNWINYRSSLESLDNINNKNLMEDIPVKWLEYIEENLE